MPDAVLDSILKPENLQNNTENDNLIKVCDKTEEKNEGYIKSNGWKTTFFVVLVNSKYKNKRKIENIFEILSHSQISLFVRSLLYAKAPKYQKNADGFLQLVPEKYLDSELVEWEPAPDPISRPEEPGNMGKFL